MIKINLASEFKVIIFSYNLHNKHAITIVYISTFDLANDSFDEKELFTFIQIQSQLPTSSLRIFQNDPECSGIFQNVSECSSFPRTFSCEVIPYMTNFSLNLINHIQYKE